MAQFYLTLPSNSSMKYYSNNTLTRYTTRLEYPINLTGSWVVGLAEIQYQQTWYNLERGEGKFTYSQVLRKNEKVSSLMVNNLRIPAGFYDTIQDLIEALNTLIRTNANTCSYSGCAVFRYNTTSRRVHVVINSGATIVLSPALSSILGFGTRQSPLTNSEDSDIEVQAARCSDINRDLYSLYGYCNVLEQTPIGDTIAPLLRIVHNNGKSGDLIHRIYEKPLYVPLQQKVFDSIEIDIRSDTGDPIAFEYGKVVVVLHFRLSRLPYLLQ